MEASGKKVCSKSGNVNGRQLDLFTGKKTIYRAFMKRHRLSRITVFPGGDRCDDLDAPGIPRRGQG